jgi:putative transposase
LPVADNLLGQVFEAQAPDGAWHADITCVETGEGWLYVAGVKDQFTGEIVGYAMGGRMTQELTLAALEKAIGHRKPAPGLVHHSGRGSQYCALEYGKLLKKHGLVASMPGRATATTMPPSKASGAASRTSGSTTANTPPAPRRRHRSGSTSKSFTTANAAKNG